MTAHIQQTSLQNDHCNLASRSQMMSSYNVSFLSSDTFYGLIGEFPNRDFVGCLLGNSRTLR